MTPEVPIRDQGKPRKAELLAQWGSRAVWVLVVALATHLVQFVNEGFDRPAHGFVSHYTASQLGLNGAEVAQFYDDDWFKVRVSEHEPTVIDPYGTNLPTMSLLMLPLTVFDYQQARVVWTVASLVLLIVTLAVLMWQLNLTANWIAAFSCYVLLYQPLYEHLFHGQMYILALALLTASLVGISPWQCWAGRGTARDIAGNENGSADGLAAAIVTPALASAPVGRWYDPRCCWLILTLARSQRLDEVLGCCRATPIGSVPVCDGVPDATELFSTSVRLR